MRTLLLGTLVVVVMGMVGFAVARLLFPTESQVLRTVDGRVQGTSSRSPRSIFDDRHPAPEVDFVGPFNEEEMRELDCYATGRCHDGGTL
jgi:hypothetical protein